MNSSPVVKEGNINIDNQIFYIFKGMVIYNYYNIITNILILLYSI